MLERMCATCNAYVGGVVMRIPWVSGKLYKPRKILTQGEHRPTEEQLDVTPL